METTQLVEVLSRAGVSGYAMPDALARAASVFTTEPSNETLTAWAQRLRTEAPHLFTPDTTDRQASPADQVRQAILARLSPSEKLTRARAEAPPPAKRRPVTRALTPAELAGPELAGLTGAAYVEKARQMQQTPAPGTG